MFDYLLKFLYANCDFNEERDSVTIDFYFKTVSVDIYNPDEDDHDYYTFSFTEIVKWLKEQETKNENTQPI